MATIYILLHLLMGYMTAASLPPDPNEETTSANYMTAATPDTGVQTASGWTLVMKVAHKQGIGEANSIHDLWTGTYTVNEGNEDAMSLATRTETYKSSIVDNWTAYNITAVRVSFVTGGKEKAYVVFDGYGSDKKNWFSKSRILYSSWKDLNPQSTTSYDSIDGFGFDHRRRFYMNRHIGGCNIDAGWFVVLDTSTLSFCDWEKRTSRPYFMYSDEVGYETSVEQAIADVIAIWVSMDMCEPNPCSARRSCIYSCVCHGNLLGDNCDQSMNICQPVQCHNGAICKHQCICTGNYFGNHCENLNGGFSNWSSYGNCSMICGTGNMTRTRTCNNPTPSGSGSSCSGNTSETTSCNIHPCPINGGWSSWSEWGPCSKTCGNGTQQKNRTCNDPSPQHGGADCEDNPSTATANQTCNMVNCPSVCPNTSDSMTCACPNHVINMTSEKLLEAIAALKEELKVDKSQTSMNIRRKISAKDSRTSAKTIGAVGAVMLATPFVLIMLSDLTSLHGYINTKMSEKRTWPPV